MVYYYSEKVRGGGAPKSIITGASEQAFWGLHIGTPDHLLLDALCQLVVLPDVDIKSTLLTQEQPKIFRIKGWPTSTTTIHVTSRGNYLKDFLKSFRMLLFFG